MENEDFTGTKKNTAAPVPADDLPEADGLPAGIDGKQAAVALAMIRDGLPLNGILERAGVSGAEFAEWVRQGAFPQYAASLARGFAEADAPYVWNTLLREARDGNVPAIRLYFDIWSKLQSASASREGAVRELRDPAVESLRSDLFGG